MVALQRVDGHAAAGVARTNGGPLPGRRHPQSAALFLSGHQKAIKGRVPCLGASAGACTGPLFHRTVSGIVWRAPERDLVSAKRSITKPHSSI